MTYSYDGSTPHALSGQFMTATMVCGVVGAGGSGDVLALGGFRLKNDWKVGLFVPIKYDSTTGGITVTTPPAVGTNNPETTFHVWMNASPTPPLFSAKIIIEGPSGTSPYTIP
jgi:hypothetical protein